MNGAMLDTTRHDLSLLPRGHQAEMAGDDWLSDRDRNSQAKAEAARKKAALAASKKLQAAADALSELMAACNDCKDGSSVRREDDGRILLMRNILEYAGWLDNVYSK
jgi:hypothetical protein